MPPGLHRNPVITSSKIEYRVDTEYSVRKGSNSWSSGTEPQFGPGDLADYRSDISIFQFPLNFLQIRLAHMGKAAASIRNSEGIES